VQHKKVAGKLAISETELQAFFKHSSDLLCIIQPDGAFGQLNPAWKRLLDWTPEDLQSCPWIELVHPEDVEATQRVMQQVRDDQPGYVDNRYRHKDGSYRQLSWSLRHSEDGHWYVIATEITAHKQVKMTLEPQIEPKAGRLEGSKRKERGNAAGKPFSTSTANEPKNSHVQPRWRAIPSVPFSSPARKWSVERKTIVMLGVASVILVTLNGLFYRSFIKQKQTSDQVNKSQQTLQKLEGVLSSMKDAETGQRGYLLTRRESYLEPYNLAVKKVDQQIAILKRLTVTDPNQQQVLSSLEPLIAQKLAELQETIVLRKNKGFEAAVQVVLTNQGQKLMDQIRALIQKMQENKNQQLQNWLAEKEQEAKAVQLMFLVGIVLNLFAFYLVYRAIKTETTERQQAEVSLKQLNEELETRVQERTAELKEANVSLLHSNRELEQFAYVASHDLQEPLRAVNSYAQLIARKYQGNLDAKADKYIGYIMEGAVRMQQLINDLLEFSRVGTRGKELEPTDCEKVLGQVLNNLKVAIAESNAVVTHDPLPRVIGDETQLLQLFQNLLSNAIKFHRSEPPQVHVKAQQQDNEWLFSISDNGIGMEPEYFERIFMIFQRLHSRSEYPGTGIGLAICKKIVERHGGHMWVDSTPGVGTTFYFTFPLLEQ
jgi:PAS domain S-box-containing protein